MRDPKWFVQTSDGMLHGYINRQMLRIDLLTNKKEDVKIFEFQPSIGRIRYAPITREKFLEQKEEWINES